MIRFLIHSIFVPPIKYVPKPRNYILNSINYSNKRACSMETKKTSPVYSRIETIN